MSKIKHQRRLPHIYPVGSAFFVTWRLEDSLPYAVAQKLRASYDEELSALKKKGFGEDEVLSQQDKLTDEYFEAIDNVLDRVTDGAHYLKDDDIAKIVEAKLRAYDQKYYRLVAFCIMSNHVHALFDFSVQVLEDITQFKSSEYVQLPKVMQLIKGGTARDCNVRLKRTGTFWAEESYDTVIRNPKHYERVISYILNNPVKAGLCETWEDYPYIYVAPKTGLY